MFPISSSIFSEKIYFKNRSQLEARVGREGPYVEKKSKRKGALRRGGEYMYGSGVENKSTVKEKVKFQEARLSEGAGASEPSGHRVRLQRSP